MRLLLCLCVVMAACSSPKDRAKRGELCVAENRPEHLIGVVQRDDLTVETAPITEELALVVGDTRISVPNGERLFKGADGVLLEMYRGGKVSESIRLDLGRYASDKLCLFFRPGKDLTFTEGWNLDAAANAPRCRCWE